MEDILHHLGWFFNPINNGMFTTYQLVIRISQPSTRFSTRPTSLHHLTGKTPGQLFNRHDARSGKKTFA
jgi:hypothetical protein